MSLPRPKQTPESKRVREVACIDVGSLHGPELDAEAIDGGVGLPDHAPRPSSDASLTALAQLAAIRLRASRALISLIDNTHQHVLAEATPAMTLQSRAASVTTTTAQLWLGNVSVPRSAAVCAVCETVLEGHILDFNDGQDGIWATVINDLASDHRFAACRFINEGPRLHFYAGVPLVGRRGSILGVLCIFDEQPREGMSRHDLGILQDLAAAVVDHLNTYRLREAQRHGERMTRGLISFVEGRSSLKEHADNSPTHQGSPKGSQEIPPHDQPQQPVTVSTNEPSPSHDPGVRNVPHRTHQGPTYAFYAGPKGATSSSSRRQHDATDALQNEILPANTKSMFSRAANIIRTTSELDGVAIFDASLAAVGQRTPKTALDPPTTRSPSLLSSVESSESDNGSGTDRSETPSVASNHSPPLTVTPQESRGKTQKLCQVLGFAIGEQSGVAGHIADRLLEERDLKTVLNLYPDGKVLTFDDDDQLISTDDDLKSPPAQEKSPQPTGGRRPKSDHVQRSLNALRAVAPKSQSLALVPLWDFDRSRWFAVAVCWSNRKDRVLSGDIDLVYLKVFGNSIMTELSRLDAISSSRTKATFVASISHELRSPLHGMLGAMQLFEGTELDSFQLTMLNSMTACAQTLQDTLDHVLDHAKINEFNKYNTGAAIRNTSRGGRRARKWRNHRPAMLDHLVTTSDLSVATEEVVESVFSGHSFRSLAAQEEERLERSGTDIPQTHLSFFKPMQSDRKPVYVLFDIPFSQDWCFSLPVGAWRRIVMNLFGNAMKYTNAGFVKISLQSMGSFKLESEQPPVTNISLVVADSGTGISSDYLVNKLFQPFAQENSLSPGAGLGLSIVRQIVESIGGKVDIMSEVGEGTRVTIKLSLQNAPAKAQDDAPSDIQRIRQRLQGRRVCLLRKIFPDDEDSISRLENEGHSRFAFSLEAILRDWLNMDVVQSYDWHGHGSDIVICLGPSFAYLEQIRSQRPDDGKAPVTIFLAMDAMEASALRSDARVVSKESVVEIVTQPCGPIKMAKLLDHCLNRYYSDSENLRSSLERPHYVAQQSNSPGIRPVGTMSNSEDLLNRRDATSSTTPSSRPPSTAPTEVQEDDEVLIVDDNDINRRLLVTLMKKQRLRYREAVNGLEALEYYTESPSRHAVILMDISMPIMDGMTATRKIRDLENQHDLKRCTIIALTGLASASARLEAIASGFDHFLSKPIKFGALLPLLPEKPAE